jgi:hypothetical protein
MPWIYYNPKFQYEKIYDDLIWGWAGHKYFVYDFVRNVKPKKIVELGTHRGTSLFSMCQAIKDGSLQTNIHAVDTWKGDKHSGFYDEAVFVEVNKIKNIYYRKQSIHLLRRTFDQAVRKFNNKSIDLLHIDGLHTYEAVKHDFEAWLVKVKNDGMILLHDTDRKDGDFGVYQLWAKLKKKYKTFSFNHCSGLGILFRDRYLYFQLNKVMNEWVYHYSNIYENRLKNHITDIENKNMHYKHSLDTITSSKAYKLWQRYCQIKKTLHI